jgi:hypothetical protein
LSQRHGADNACCLDRPGWFAKEWAGGTKDTMSQPPTEDWSAPGSATAGPAGGADPRVRTVATAGVVAAATVAVALIPGARVAYEAPSLDAMIETAGNLITLLAAYLVVGRFRESRRLDDLVLACGLGALFASSLLFQLLAASGAGRAQLPPWPGQLLGARQGRDAHRVHDR